MDLIQNEDYAADSCAISLMAFLLYELTDHVTNCYYDVCRQEILTFSFTRNEKMMSLSE